MVAIAMNIEPLLLTTREASQALRVCPDTLHQMERKGAIRPVRLGRAKRYPVEALKAMVATLSQAPQPQQ